MQQNSFLRLGQIHCGSDRLMLGIQCFADWKLLSIQSLRVAFTGCVWEFLYLPLCLMGCEEPNQTKETEPLLLR